MSVAVSLELQVFHKISWIYQNSQDCLENSLNPKLIPKFPRFWENSQAVAALRLPLVIKYSLTGEGLIIFHILWSKIVVKFLLTLC